MKSALAVIQYTHKRMTTILELGTHCCYGVRASAAAATAEAGAPAVATTSATADVGTAALAALAASTCASKASISASAAARCTSPGSAHAGKPSIPVIINMVIIKRTKAPINNNMTP
jgi:hypothetical protein